MQIRPLDEKDVEAVKQFTDVEIGKGYFSIAELKDICLKSQSGGQMFSLVLADDSGQIQGIRITYPPGNWRKGKGEGLSTSHWPHPVEQTAYFQSIFIASSLHGKGWGVRLSLEALRMLRKAGAKGVVCHSWKESPHDSSGRYLKKLGFVTIAEYPGYWSAVPYDCSRCKKPPCQCTAEEMYLNLERTPV